MLKKLLYLLMLISYTLSSQIIYVDQNATGSNNGTDWANAYTDLQTAIANIGANTTINVAQGTYYPTATTDRTIYFNIPRDKKLFGGFPTGGGTRNPDLYPTILSGDIGTIGDNTDNSYHVVYFLNTSPTNEFDGFIIEKGYANGTGTNENNGGGIYFDTYDTSSYQTFIRNCIVRNNYASNNGGGIMIYHIAEIYNCKIYSNYAGNSGGGIYDDTDGRIYNSLIVNNSSGNTGGGISITGFNSAPKAINCIIVNNEAVTNGSGADLYRGLLINCTVANNKGPNGVRKYNSSVGGGVQNSIIWGNTGNQTSRALEEGWDYNCAVQGITDYLTYIGLTNNNEGNITGINYPRFTKPTSFTGNATTQAQLDEILNANWYINPQSAAVDFGDNSLYPSSDTRTPSIDIIGNNRTINTTIDAGAYEALTNIITTDATNQQPTSADLNGEVLFAATTNTITRGFVYATTPNFDVTTATSITNSATGLGTYSDNITGLTENQLYYYRTWVAFDGTKYYGNELPFKASNLVAYYPFNGNANDESGNGNNGTVNGATLTTDRFGNANSAYNFNGVDNDITCLFPGPIGTSPRTISFWAKTSEVATGVYDNAIISYGSNTVYGQRFEIDVNSQTRGLGIDINGAALTKDFDNSNNNWHYYAAVFDGGTNKTMYDVKLYADGNLLTTNTFEITNGTIFINTSSETPIHIGSLFNAYRFFNGDIDDVKFYNKALTATEIQNEANGLVAYYPFNGNANDESGNGNNGTVNGATLTTDRFGSANSAYYFDGSSNYISIADNPNINIQTSESFSISYWCKYDAQNRATYLISKYKGSFGEPSFALGAGSGDLAYSWFEFTPSNGIENRGAIHLYDTNWHNITTVFKSGVSISIYVDGVLDITKPITYTGSIINTRNLTIGCGSNLAQFYKGSIDDIKIYNKALTATEIQNEANGLVAYYPFNGNANDESGNGNNGIVNGATLTTDRFGSANSAYYFDGSDIISVAHNDILNCSNELSISVWVKPNSLQNAMILGKSNYTSATNYLLRTKSTGYIAFEYKDFANSNSLPLTANVWNHIAVISKSDNSKQVYINGVLATHTSATSPFGLVTNALTIGAASYNAEYFNGNIDDLRIYSKALTETQILNLFTNNTLAVNKIALNTNTKFYVYHNVLYFKNTQNLEEIRNVEAFNLLGQKVFETSKIEKEIPINNLQKGMYILKVSAKNSNYNTLKFLSY